MRPRWPTGGCRNDDAAVQTEVFVVQQYGHWTMAQLTAECAGRGLPVHRTKEPMVVSLATRDAVTAQGGSSVKAYGEAEPNLRAVGLL